MKGANLMNKYIYGMRVRGRGYGCQPNDFIEVLRDETDKFHDILIYDRKLTDKEVKYYQLTFIKEINKEIDNDYRKDISNMKL